MRVTGSRGDVSGDIDRAAGAAGYLPNYGQNNMLAGPSGNSGLPDGRGSDAVRAAALARYKSLPDAQKALLLKTFLNSSNNIYAEKNGKASEYEIAVGHYQKNNGDVYFLDSGVNATEHDVTDISALISMGSLDAKRSLTWVVELHSHSDDRSPGLSIQDSGAFNQGYILIFGNQRVSLPMEYSGAFYGKQQIFYGWTRAENFTLTFDEFANAIK